MAFSDVTKKSRTLFDSKYFTVKKSHIAPGIKDFEIIKPISRGAFGQVYLARKNGSEKLYALKSMKKNDVRSKNMMDQVVAERDTLAISSKSPFVVQLFYSFQSDENIFLVMEYMIGGDIKSLLHNMGYFEMHMAKFYIAEVVLALEYLHSHSIFHRDIKPDNMLLSNTGHVKLTDFGLSCLTSECKPNFLDLINTPGISTNADNESNHNKRKIFWRTPGQLQSLTSKFTFSIPRVTTKRERYKTNDNIKLSAIADSTTNSKDFMFSPPQLPQNNAHASASSSVSFLSTPQYKKISSTPNIIQPAKTEVRHDTAMASTGLTADVTSLTLETLNQRKRSYNDIQDDNNDDEKENINAQESIRKRVRVYSQSLPCELEISQEATKVTKTNLVTFADKVHNCEDTCESSQISITVSEVENNTTDINCSQSQHDFSANANISGVTALTETSHMSMSACGSSSIMLSPHNAVCNVQSCKCTYEKNLHFTPSPSQFCASKEDNCSSSVTPKTVLRQASDIMITPIQMLKFFESPDVIVRRGPVESVTDAVNYIKKTPDGNLSLDSNSVMVSPRQTPFRTPKSCLRGKATPAERRRILGTPDYLAPEILLGKQHGAPVDWWALGVCFYEFLTGIPPFNDDSPELVFDHILDHDMIWPDGEESLPKTAVDAIQSMLTIDPEKRPKAESVKVMECFIDIDWSTLLDQNAPFIPQPDDVYDTTYFDAKNNANQFQMSLFKP